MQSIDNYAAQEEFIINDIILRVNATDIQVFDQKFTDSYSAIRNNSTYSISSNASIATYVSTLAFDLDNEDDLFNLVKLCTQLCKYPFLFIKSQRIDQFIPSVSKSINSYNIFAVKEWSIRHDSRAKNAIFVTIDMHYFNYVPYIKDFRFLDYALIDSSNTRTDNVASKKASLLSVDNLYESKIFQDYFASDFNIKKEKTDIAIKSIIGSSHEIIFGSPEIIKAEGENAKKPIDIINSNIEYAGFEDQDTILVSYVNDNRQSSSSVEGELLNYWICYRDMPITLISDGDGNKIFDVQAMTITKKNNIVANQLQMYREPFIQYLGKSPAIMTVDISINNSEFEYSDFGHDANLKPYEILAHELRKAETFKVVGGNKLPFKSLRIRSLLNILADSNYFIIDSESSIESADDQGRQGITLNFVESDITKLVGAGNLNLSSQSLYDKELYPMIFAASELLQLYSEETSLNVNKPKTNGGIPIASDDRIQVKIKNNKPSNKENTVIANNTSSLVKLSLQERQKILSSGIDGEPNIDSLIALLFVGANNLIKSVAKGNMPAFGTYKDGLSKTAKALKLLATKLRDDKIKVDTSSQNFIEFFGATSITLKLILGKNNGKNVENAQKYPAFYTKVLQSVYSNLNVNAAKGSFNEIKGEALEDMSIFKSLVSGRFIREGSTDKEYLGEYDNRKFSPFFFIDQYTYMDPVSLIATTSAITTIAGKTLEDKESLFNRDGVTISDSSNYIPLYKVKEIDAENKSATKTKKLGKIESTKNRLERLNKYANLAYEEYTKYIKENANNKNVNKSVILTKDLFFTIIAVESDGFPGAHRSGSSYYGLFQISKANWDEYYGKETFSSKWNDPVSNTRATLDFWHKYVIPELTNKESKKLNLNPNSYFNLYMMHQQGAAGYRSIIKLYRNTSTRGAVVRDVNLRNKMIGNFPGQNEAKTRWDYRPDSWLKAWKDKFYSKTGIDSQIFGYTEPVKTQGYTPLSVGNLTTGIGAPANANLVASIYKKQEGPDSKAKPKVEDGDTFSFPSSMFEAREGKLPNGSLRIYGIDTKEKNHRKSGLGQKYSIDALLAAEDILSKMVYPIKIYSLGDTSGERDLVIVVDKNGSDFAYEMIKAGLAKYSTISEEELKGRSAIYRDIYNQTESLLKVDSQETSQDATKKAIGGSEAQTTFDIQSYENKVAIALGDNSGDYTLSQRSDALMSKTDDPDRLTRPDDGLLTRPGKDAYSQIDTDSKPYGLEFDEDINMQYRCIRTGNHIASGLDLAVPSVKAYIVEGLRSDEFARYNLVAPRETNLYEISGLTDVRIETPTPDNPVSVAAFTVLNPGSIYTDIAAIARRGGAYYPDYTENNLDPNFASKSGKLIIKTGTRIHIRIGYSNNPNELETIFNGEIVEVEGEEILEIIAEGYGRELIAIDKAVEEPEDLGSKSATTNLVIHRLLEADEIYHLGLKKYATNVVNPIGRNLLDGATVDASDPNLTSSFTKVWEAIYGWFASDDPNGLWFGDWWAKSSELYTNVYSPIIQGMDPEMSGDIKIRYLVSSVKDIDLIFPLYKSTTWEALREVQYRHPGTYMNVMNYKERGSLFFGIKEQMYIYTDPPISTFTGATESFETYNKEVNAIKHKLLKPATDMHLIVSERDIISNQIKVDAGFKTQINVRYFDNMPSAEGIEDMSDYNFYTMQLDDNLRPNAIRSKTLYMNACHQQFMAYRYGTTELIAEAEKMYDGKIIIVGNPYMKAGDYAYINDSYRGLNGIIKIRSCSHIINSKDGYITVITPGLFIEPRIYRYSNLYTKLGLAWTVAANKIKNDAKVNFFDTRKIKYVTSFMEILTNPLLAEQLNSSPLSYGNKSALALDLTLKALPGVIGGAALYRAFPWLTRQVISVAATISSSTLGGAISTAATSARVSTALILGARSLGGGALGFLSRVSLATLGGLSAGVQRGVSVAAIVAASPALVAAGTTIIGATILAMYLYQTIEEINQTRQPIVMYPLLNNGIPYQAGLFGYEINTLNDSFGLEFNKTMSAINTIYKAARSEYLRSSESDNAKLEKTLKYLNTINKTASPDLFYRSKEIKW